MDDTGEEKTASVPVKDNSRKMGHEGRNRKQVENDETEQSGWSPTARTKFSVGAENELGVSGKKENNKTVKTVTHGGKGSTPYQRIISNRGGRGTKNKSGLGKKVDNNIGNIIFLAHFSL